MHKLPEQRLHRRSGPRVSSRGRRNAKRHARRYTMGSINAGVSHGVKRPKPKRHSDTGKSNLTDTVESLNNYKENHTNICTENADAEEHQSVVAIERSMSPEIDPNKRFFKNKRTTKSNYTGTETTNNYVKLKVTPNSKIALKRKNSQPIRQVHKRAKLMDISFDTADLTVDEPELEATIGQKSVADILKVLEDDWADDDYDILDTLTNRKFDNISPLEPLAVLKDVTMSSEIELHNTTDTSALMPLETISLNNNLNNIKENKQKYYPIFNKESSAVKVVEETGKKSASSMKENIGWQLCAKRNGSDNQYQLDAGQKNFGATQCTECGVVYQIGDPEDENAHLNYHNNRKSLKFPGWKTEHVIMEEPFTSDRVILVEPGDPKQYWNKVGDILAYVDRDLGLVDTKLSDYENKKVYLYIRDKVILGVLVAEHINTAHRMIPELLELNCCTAESTPAKCGINVVWTDMNHRKQGIATKLIDMLRANFYYGYIMPLDDIAFSIPTSSGKIFAEKYTKTRNFKVYT